MTPISRSGLGRRSLATLVCGALAAGARSRRRSRAQPRAASASSHREAPLIWHSPVRQHRPVRLRSAGQLDTTTVIANFIPFEQLWLARTSTRSPTTPSTTSTSTTTVTRRASWCTGTPSDDPQERRHVPLQHGPGQQPRRPGPEHHADLRHRPAAAAQPEAGLQDEGRGRHPGCAVERRQGLDARLHEAPQPGRVQARGRLTQLRRPGGRPLLRRSAGLRPAVRRQPVRGRAGARQGSATSTRWPCRCPTT